MAIFSFKMISKVAPRWRWAKGVMVGIAIALMCSGFWVEATQAQSPVNPFPIEPSAPANENDAPADSTNPVIRPLQNWTPPEVKALFEEDENAEIAQVNLDGRTLFQVAAPSDDSSSLTARERAVSIEEHLERIALNTVESDSLAELDITYEVDQESNQPIILINGEMLMTVTYLDARINRVNSLTLRARQIVNELQLALTRFYEERQPDYLWQQTRWALATLLITLLGSFAIGHFIHKMRDRRRQLKQHRPAQSTAAAADEALDSATVRRMRTTLLTQQKINSLGILTQFLRVLQIALWVASGLLILGLYPYTRWLQPLLVEMMRLPFRFAVVMLIAYGLIRLASLWIDRLFIIFQGRTVINLERSQRLLLRLSTFSQVIKGVVAFLIGGIAILTMLSFLGVQVAPLLAGAGLIGFAISFASQSLIRDIINGFLVLLEDQYGVGDVIEVRGLAGFVENMNLRITQLRATDGQLITIPNGQIDIVQNLSKEWSRVDLMIPIGLAADINQALQVVEQEANAMQRDAIWGSLILEPPLLLGVDELSHAGATIRIWIKTQPLKQWDVAREYRRRLKIAFEHANIPIGVPQQIVQFAPSSSVAGASLQEHQGNGGTADPPARKSAATPG